MKAENLERVDNNIILYKYRKPEEVMTLKISIFYSL